VSGGDLAPVLESERLVLRGWCDEDFEPWARLCADDEVMRSLGREGGLTRDEAWRDMAVMAGHWALKGFGHWVLEERETGELVGRAGLWCPPDWPAMEVGWTVARERWGEGFAGEAARVAAGWAHEALGARHLISLIEPANARSLRVAEKLGERLEGRTTVRQTELLVYGIDLPLGPG
jgi:RimJ/RimL family protein N-acetyltransferase